MELSVVVASRPSVAPEDDLAVAAVADRLGYGELWVGEGWVWDAFALTTAIAVQTERIDLTVGPIPVSVRDPASIARAAASTAAVAKRPVGVALGSSSKRMVEGAHGLQRHRPVSAMAEAVQAIRMLYAGGEDFQGELVSTHGFRLRLGSPGGPITVAAFGDRAITVAAEHADRMVLDLVTPDQTRRFRAKLDAASARLGRPSPALAAWLPAAVDPEPAAYEQVLTSLAGYLEVAGYGEMFTAAGFGEAVELAETGAPRERLVAALPDDAGFRIGLVGDHAAIESRIAEYADAGLDEIVLVPALAGDPGAARSLEALRAFDG